LGYRLDNQKIKSLIPDNGKRFFTFGKVQTGSGGDPASCSMGNRHFSWGERVVGAFKMCSWPLTCV